MQGFTFFGEITIVIFDNLVVAKVGGIVIVIINDIFVVVNVWTVVFNLIIVIMVDSCDIINLLIKIVAFITFFFFRLIAMFTELF